MPPVRRGSRHRTRRRVLFRSRAVRVRSSLYSRVPPLTNRLRTPLDGISGLTRRTGDQPSYAAHPSPATARRDEDEPSSETRRASGTAPIRTEAVTGIDRVTPAVAATVLTIGVPIRYPM